MRTYDIIQGVGFAAGLLLAGWAGTADAQQLRNQAPAHYANKPFIVEPIVHEVHPLDIARKCREVARRRGFQPVRASRLAGCATIAPDWSFCEIVVPDRDWPPYFSRSAVIAHEEARCKGYVS